MISDGPGQADVAKMAGRVVDSDVLGSAGQAGWQVARDHLTEDAGIHLVKDGHILVMRAVEREHYERSMEVVDRAGGPTRCVVRIGRDLVRAKRAILGWPIQLCAVLDSDAGYSNQIP